MSQSTPFRKYTESGIAPVVNVIGLFFTAIVFIFALSLLYNILIRFISFVYVNVIIIVGFGYSLAYLSRYLNIAFKIRSKKKSMIITGVITLLAMYIQWAIFMYVISVDDLAPWQDILIILDIFLNPYYIFSSLAELNQYGTWEVGKTAINGGILWFIWCLEALLIVAIPLRLYFLFDILPFSEKDNRWYKKRRIDKEFEYISLRSHFLKSFYESPIETINSLGKPDYRRYSNIYIYSDKNHRSYLIEIENVMVDSKSKKDYMEVLPPSYIDHQTVKKIQETYKII